MQETPPRLADLADPDPSGLPALLRSVRGLQPPPPGRLVTVRRSGSWGIMRARVRARLVLVALVMFTGGGWVGASLHRWSVRHAAKPGAIVDPGRTPLAAKRNRQPRAHAAGAPEPVRENADESITSAQDMNQPLVSPPSVPSGASAPTPDAPIRSPLALRDARMAAPASARAKVDRSPNTHRQPPSAEPAPIATIDYPARRHLFEALRFLQQGDPERALNALDAGASSKPDADLDGELLSTRLTALARLRREAAVLDALDHAQATTLARMPELLVARAERRLSQATSHDDITNSSIDFQSALADGLSGHNAERARYGHAAAAGLLGDHARERRELEQYLADWPAGRFADKARRALGTKP